MAQISLDYVGNSVSLVVFSARRGIQGLDNSPQTLLSATNIAVENLAGRLESLIVEAGIAARKNC